MSWTSQQVDEAVARAEEFEQDYREAEEKCKTLKSYADKFAAIGYAIVERPGERPSLVDELDKAVMDYYRDSRQGKLGR
jgi:hypothetical protein